MQNMISVWKLSAVNYAKTAEPIEIEIQFGMLSRVGPENRVLYWGGGEDSPARRGEHYSGVWPIESIVKHVK